MRLLVVGGGGREHALCWALRREDPRAELYALPETLEPRSWPTTSTLRPTIWIVWPTPQTCTASTSPWWGPKLPLARGLADRLRAEGRAVFGPNAAAAQIEASKAFAKDVMASAGVRTAASQSFVDLKAALAFVDAHPEPLVVKASGLAAGKGAIVCTTRKEAAQAVRAMLERGDFGSAGRTVVIEAYLEGEEISVMAITNGRELELLPVAQDHKRLLEGDRGPNTGGMGAYSPVAVAGPALLERVKRDVLLPTLEQLQRTRTPFAGVLYAGLMIDGAGTPRVVEFNCRLGDPEAQVILPLVSRGLIDSLSRVGPGRGAHAHRFQPRCRCDHRSRIEWIP